MCAINPRHKKRIIFDFYTSHREMTKEEFDNYILEWSLEMERKNNELNPKIRLHVKETDQQAE